MNDFLGAAPPLSTEEKRALLAKLLQNKVQQESNRFPLSYGQRALWFLHQSHPASHAYNLSMPVGIKSSVDVSALKQTFQILVNRHPSLRTTFPRQADGSPGQVVSDTASVDFNQIDATTWSRDYLEQTVASSHGQPFNLGQGPLFRVSLFTHTQQDHILLVTTHHIIFDAWSSRLLLNEAEKIYLSLVAGEDGGVSPISSSYGAYVNWQYQTLEKTGEEKLWGYWKTQLGGDLPVLDLPTDRPHPPHPSCQGTYCSFKLLPGQSHGLRALAQREGTTPYALLLAIFQVLLYRYTGQSDILVGSPMGGRSQPEFEKIIGYFVNPVVIRGRPEPNLSFQEFLQQIFATVLGALDHQDYPFPLLVEKLQPNRDPSRSPVFQVLFNYLQAKPTEAASVLILSDESFPELQWAGLDIASVALEQEAGQFDLMLEMAETPDQIMGVFKYSTDVFDRDTVERMVGHFKCLLDGILTNPQQSLARLPMVPAPEQHQLLNSGHGTQMEYPEDKRIHQLFEAQVERTPDAVAVVFEGQSLTYGELNRRSNQLAHYLRSLGIGPDHLVGICLERSLDMVVGLLAILKAGGAYIPLDPAYPRERLTYMVTDSQLSIVLTQQACHGKFAPQTVRLVTIDGDSDGPQSDGPQSDGPQSDGPQSEGPQSEGPQSEGPQSEGPQSATHGEDNLPGVPGDALAYTIYTSGSTGNPKGVQISHRAAVNFLLSMAHTPGLTQQDRLLAVTTISFDIAVLELYLPLLVGAQVILASRQVAANSAELAALLHQSQATVMQATPATWQLLLAHGWSGDGQLKILCGGEAMSRDLADQLLQCGGQLWNMYGPTEATVWSAVCQVTPGKNPVPVAGPIANTQLYVLDPNPAPGQAAALLPMGIPGELHIGGDGLARGYLRRSELTQSRFIADPFSDKPGARLYKTGDLARFRPDGTLEFLGRMDHQVKLRGFRIELGEIEAGLAKLPNVQKSVALIREDQPGDKRLVAYVTLDQRDALKASTLRQHLQQTLPEYMVPSSFVLLDAFPLTPNGKINRRQLPKPDQASLGIEDSYVAPQTERQRQIVDIWQEILQIDQVGIHDNFFDLGGHSILVSRLHSQLLSRLEGISEHHLSVIDLFSYPTISRLVQHLANHTSEPVSVMEVSHQRATKQMEARQRRQQQREKKSRPKL